MRLPPLLIALLLLAGCAAAPPVTRSSAGQPLAPPLTDWQHRAFPGKQATSYAPAWLDGRPAMAARAEASASVLRQRVRLEPDQLGHVRFSWKVPNLIHEADLARREVADSPVRLILAFEGARSKFSLKDTLLSELVHTLTGEPMPYATLMYVWCNHRPPGSVIGSPRTERIRKLVVESGSQGLNQWLAYERDIRADFERAFGEPPGALIGMAIMTDTDNTRSTAQAWYGPVQLVHAPTASR